MTRRGFVQECNVNDTDDAYSRMGQTNVAPSYLVLHLGRTIASTPQSH